LNLTFYIVDVFAEEKYAGNQLAIVRGGAGLPDEGLQKMALEMNYSETAFVLSEEETEGAMTSASSLLVMRYPSPATPPSVRRT
jgi:PhzF family phenazine biosynthesis protein